MRDVKEQLRALDQIDLPELWERAASMEPLGDVPDHSDQLSWQRRAAAGVVAFGVFAGAIALALGVFGSDESIVPNQPAGLLDIPIEQSRTIRGVLEAIDERDEETFVSSFTQDGTFNPYAVWGPIPVREVIPTWMENVDIWGLEAVVRSCESGTESMVACDVRTQWNTLRMEMAEQWNFVFEGKQLRSLVMIRSNRDPTDRSLPLGYGDLDSWESWLEETHPGQAAVLLQDTPHIASFLRYDPTLAVEIGASIREYLDGLAADPDRDG